MRDLLSQSHHRSAVALAAALLAVGASAQINSYSNGSSGALDVTSANLTVDLSLATTGKWDDPNVGPNGVYDPEKWAIVFHYTSVNVAAGLTVSFLNHPSGAPVVWLVQGDVTISGAVALNGQRGDNVGRGVPRTPGPGGFRGGASNVGNTDAGQGMGPGAYVGQRLGSAQGSFGTAGNNGGKTYSFQRIIPLIGGSGGTGWFRNDYTRAGGAGGGAILIVAGGTLTIGTNGSVQAIGGYSDSYAGAGSGGAIRLIADRVAGTGTLYADAEGWSAGWGRIAVEYNSGTLSFRYTVNTPSVYTLQGIGTEPIVWPEHWEAQMNERVPTCRVVRVGTSEVPLDPRASLEMNTGDVNIEGLDKVDVFIMTEHVPTDGSWGVDLQAVPRVGSSVRYTAVWDEALNLWVAKDVALKPGAFAMQARAFKK